VQRVRRATRLDLNRILLILAEYAERLDDRGWLSQERVKDRQIDSSLEEID
jgi:hypothetical protein